MSEIEMLAWLLDNSIPVPFFGGRRLGADAIIARSKPKHSIAYAT